MSITWRVSASNVYNNGKIMKKKRFKYSYGPDSNIVKNTNSSDEEDSNENNMEFESNELTYKNNHSILNNPNNRSTILKLVYNSEREISNIKTALQLGQGIPLKSPESFEDVFKLSGIPLNPSQALIVSVINNENENVVNERSRGKEVIRNDLDKNNDNDINDPNISENDPIKKINNKKKQFDMIISQEEYKNKLKIIALQKYAMKLFKVSFSYLFKKDRASSKKNSKK